MSKPSGMRTTIAASMLASTLLSAPIAAMAQSAAAPESAPSSEVSSGQKVTGHHHTRKSKYLKTSPEQPAPATAEKVPPSERLPEEPNQVKDQVAPVPDAPVKPGTNVAPGNDTPKPQG